MSILDIDSMGYLGVSGGKVRLIKVDNTGNLKWGSQPNNQAAAGIYSRISVFPNGTALIGGNGFYMAVDTKGNGEIHTRKGITGRYGTFSIGSDGDDAVSYSGSRYAPMDSIAPLAYQPEPIIHEDTQTFITFKKKGTGGRIYEMDGRRFVNVTLQWEYVDFSDRCFFKDALFTINYERFQTYPNNQYIQLEGSKVTKDDFHRLF